METKRDPRQVCGWFFCYNADGRVIQSLIPFPSGKCQLSIHSGFAVGKNAERTIDFATAKEMKAKAANPAAPAKEIDPQK